MSSKTVRVVDDLETPSSLEANQENVSVNEKP